MRKGKLIAALVITGALVIPFSVFAATSDTTAAKTVRGFFGIDTSKFSTQQKADAADYSKRVADLQKEFIDKMVQNGSMTKQDGDAAKQKIDDSYKASQDNGGLYGLSPGRRMGGDFGRKGGFDKNFGDTSKLTEGQKADISTTVKKIDELSKGFIDTAVNDGLLTKAQGDAVRGKLASIPDSGKDMPFGIMGKAGLPGLGCFGLFGNDTSKLSDQQKKDIDNYTQQLNVLRKELVDKYVAAGVVTQEQGTAMLQRMEQKGGPNNDAGFRKGMRLKGKGRM